MPFAATRGERAPGLRAVAALTPELHDGSRGFLAAGGVAAPERSEHLAVFLHSPRTPAIGIGEAVAGVRGPGGEAAAGRGRRNIWRPGTH